MKTRTHGASASLADTNRTRVAENTNISRASRLATITVASLAIFCGSTVYAQPDANRDRAQRIHDRLAGVPPTAAVLESMRLDIAGGDAVSAAMTAMDDPHFYTVTLKNFAAPWTNRDESVFVPLNDYIALVMGIVRDEYPFTDILTSDRLYVGSGISPLPSVSSNQHYETLEQAMLDPNFDPNTDLSETTQSSVYGLPPGATAGAMTTRAASEAFFIAGTNRAMFRFTLINHMCMDLEQVHDTSIIPNRIRQDVSRSPGGDSRVFLNNCIGCHAGMDPMAQAFAYYNFDETTGTMEYTDGVVQPKYFNNDTTFEDGFVTPDNNWENYWREGQNANIGWDPLLPGSGTGAQSLGQELAQSQAFAQCQVEKVFQSVCLRPPVDQADRDQVTAMEASFTGTNYNLKQVFAESAAYCTN